jgi:hypothetical protein
MQKKIFIGVGLILFLILFANSFNRNKQTAFLSTNKEITFSAEKESEIYYRFHEIYHNVMEKEGPEVLPKIGEKQWKTPKKDRAVEITANEYKTTTDKINTVLKRVEERKPSDEEFRIYQVYDDKLNKAIDIEASGRELIDEEKIKQETARILGITPKKLDAIYIRVDVWKQDEKNNKK